MPYDRERSDKSSHSDIVENPDVSDFLEECEYLTTPTEEEGEEIGSRYTSPPDYKDADLPRRVISTDGSIYESRVKDKIPSTRVGFIKIGLVLIKMSEYTDLRTNDGRFVDPFKVAELREDNRSINFALPSSNVRWGDHTNVKQGFRAATDEFFHDDRTRFVPEDPSTSLRTTLFRLASRRPGDMGTENKDVLKIHKCPNDDCPAVELKVYNKSEQQYCNNCGEPIYATDCLRIWELVNESQSNYQALSRLMQDLEHLMIIHCIRHIFENSLPDLSVTSFLIDRPLAVYGNSAWLHRSIMKYIYEINYSLSSNGYSRLTLIGLQKTGRVVDHVELVNDYIPEQSLFSIDDDYRLEYITPSKERPSNGFGYETYYGQDFIFKTSSGRSFVFAIPYPYEDKDFDLFDEEKSNIDNYPDIKNALRIIHHFQSDLYENAVVPIALAHRHTAISLAPGGKVLDILSEDSLEQ